MDDTTIFGDDEYPEPDSGPGFFQTKACWIALALCIAFWSAVAWSITQ